MLWPFGHTPHQHHTSNHTFTLNHTRARSHLHTQVPSARGTRQTPVRASTPSSVAEQGREQNKSQQRGFRYTQAGDHDREVKEQAEGHFVMDAWTADLKERKGEEGAPPEIVERRAAWSKDQLNLVPGRAFSPCLYGRVLLFLYGLL